MTGWANNTYDKNATTDSGCQWATPMDVKGEETITGKIRGSKVIKQNQ